MEPSATIATWSNIARMSGHRSTVSVGDTTVTAQRGENGGRSGGAGYSGGGDDGAPGYDGGSSGGDGRGPGGGRGSGDNIRAFTLTSWSLAPGRSGGFYRGRDYYGNYYYYGGGGGGVLVDGMGPQDYSYQGQGYGGGGGGYQRFPQWSIGLQGVILLEMISYENK